jgi:hypothetical protein
VAKFKLLGGYMVATPLLSLGTGLVTHQLRVKSGNDLITLINEYLWIFKEGYIPEYK